VDEQRDICSRLVQSLAERSQSAGDVKQVGGVASGFGEMVLDMRLAQTRAVLEWLDRVGQDAAAAVERANA
jgi:hypothetical protein